MGHGRHVSGSSYETPPAPVIYPSILIENFNSYTDGNLHGQGNWSGNTGFKIDGSVIYEGAKAVKITAVTMNDIGKPCTSLVVGSLSCMIRRSVSFGTGSTYQTIYTKNAANQFTVEIGFIGNAIKYGSSGTWFTLKADYVLNTWYKIQAAYEGPYPYKCKYRVNDEAWSPWVPPMHEAAATPPISAWMEQWSLPSGATAYFDYFH